MIKNSIVILLVLAAFYASAQTKPLDPFKKQAGPDIFIDSVKIAAGNDYLKYFDPEEVLTISISKDTTYLNGAIFIGLKNHELLAKLRMDKPVSLKDICIARIQTPDKHKKVLFMIDDELVTDTSNVRIPSMFVKVVTLAKPTDANMHYFGTTFPNVILMKIYTKQPVLHIRGRELSK